MRTLVTRIVVLAAVLCGLALPAAAEVGVVGADGGRPQPLVLGAITDDPDPVGMAPSDVDYWTRYNPDGNGRAVLNDQGTLNGDGPPSVLLHPDTGVPIVAWARNSQSGFDIVVSRFEGGAWTAPEVLAGDPAVDEKSAQLICDPATGNVLVLYGIETPTEATIWMREAPADLSSWGPPQLIDDDRSFRPHAQFHNGELYVAYEYHTNGMQAVPRHVVIAKQQPDGTFWIDVVVVTYFGLENRPLLHRHDGRLWLDWIDAADEVGWTRQDEQGQWESQRYEPYLGIEEREFHVRGAIRKKAITE